MRHRIGIAVLASAFLLALSACGDRGAKPGADATGNQVVPGTTGAGTTGAAPPPGTGLAGGMGSNSATTTATAVPDGSTNRTPAGSVGNR